MAFSSVATGVEVKLAFHHGGESASSDLLLSDMSDDDLDSLVGLLSKYGRGLLAYVEASVHSTTPPSKEFSAAAKMAGVDVFDNTHPNTKAIVLQKCVRHRSDIEEIPLSMVSIGMLAKVLTEQVS